jgi:uncharacterized membrane protein
VRIRVALWSAIGAFAAGFSALAVLRHDAFESGRFDLGNMVQVVWSTAHGHPLQMTDLNGDQISRLGAHTDVLLAAFAPFWLLWPDPSLLLVAQAAIVALGALPVFWLARKHLGSPRAALGFALAYLLYPPVQWLVLDDFHAVALACPFLLFAFWYLDEDRLAPFAVFAVLAALTKEEVGLVVAGLGLWYALARGRRTAGLAIAAAGTAVSLLAILVVLPAFGEGESDFYRRYAEVGGSPGGIVETTLTDPLHVLEVAFDGTGLGYLLRLAVPFGLAVLAPLALLPALPELAINLLSSTPTQTSIHFHYTAGITPALVVGSIFGAARITRRRPALAVQLAGLTVVLSLVAGWRLGPIPLWSHLPGGEDLAADVWRVNGHDRTLERALNRIPGDAVVSASNAPGAHLSDRRRILSFPYRTDADWVVVDERRPSYADRAVAPVESAAAVAWLKRDPAWQLIFDEDGVLVFRRAVLDRDGLRE